MICHFEAKGEWQNQNIWTTLSGKTPALFIIIDVYLEYQFFLTHTDSSLCWVPLSISPFF